MWQVTCDMWYMTHDSAGWTFFQNVSFLALPVWDRQWLEDIETKVSVTEWMNYIGDCRTAPATPVLLLEKKKSNQIQTFLWISFHMNLSHKLSSFFYIFFQTK